MSPGPTHLRPEVEPPIVHAPESFRGGKAADQAAPQERRGHPRLPAQPEFAGTGGVAGGVLDDLARVLGGAGSRVFPEGPKAFPEEHLGEG